MLNLWCSLPPLKRGHPLLLLLLDRYCQHLPPKVRISLTTFPFGSLHLHDTVHTSNILYPHNDAPPPRQVSVEDAVPLFHTATLAPLLDTSAAMVDAHATSNGFSIVGFYQVGGDVLL